MKVFNFRKNNDTQTEDTEVAQDTETIENVELNQDIDNRELLESLEYTNSYLAQIAITLGELTKQQTIANALHILDSEYNNADSIMDVDEILQKKYALLGQIFIDYQVKEEKDNEND